MTTLGTAVFTDEVIGYIERCELRDGQIVFVAIVPRPHPAFDCSTWRIHGADGSVIYTVRPRKALMVAAFPAHVLGTTTCFLPCQITGGDNIYEPVSVPPSGPGEVRYT